MMGGFRTSLPLLAVVLLLSVPPPVDATSRHLHRQLQAPQENDFFFTNTSQLDPNVTANLIYGCYYRPINFTQYEGQVEALVSSFYTQLLNGTGNFTVVRLADGTLSLIRGNVTVNPAGRLLVNGNLTSNAVYNGTLAFTQKLPNITNLVSTIFQEAATATGNNGTLGSIISGLGGLIGGNLPPVPGTNLSGLPVINYNASQLTNTTQIVSYSPVTPEAILAYMQNLTAAALSAVDLGGSAGQDELNKAAATPVPTVRGATPVPTTAPRLGNQTANQTANQTLPGFPFIKVYFFVIVKASTDNFVTQQMLTDQIAKMNADYTPTPFKFVMQGAAKIVNPQWVGRSVDTEEVVFDQMKTQTRIGGPQDLNVWITDFSDQGLNGYATFPWDFKSSPLTDGIVISKYTLPMDPRSPNYQALRSVGITLTHETGHWLGLFHTFQGGCTGSGDYVADTVPEGTPNDYNDPKCATNKFSCPQLGRNEPPDPIFNFMDYGACRRLFTAGQIARLKQYWTFYRYNQG